MPLTEAVRLSNRIKFNHTQGHKDPGKREISEGDLPELMLVSQASEANLGETSSTTRMTRRYDWMIASGDLSIVKALLPLEFILLAAMTKWYEALGPLTWPDGEWPFVKRANIVSVETGVSDPARNRGINGWSSLWTVEVEMHFRTADLLEFNSGAS